MWIGVPSAASPRRPVRYYTAPVNQLPRIVITSAPATSSSIPGPKSYDRSLLNFPLLLFPFFFLLVVRTWSLPMFLEFIMFLPYSLSRPFSQAKKSCSCVFLLLSFPPPVSRMAPLSYRHLWGFHGTIDPPPPGPKESIVSLQVSQSIIFSLNKLRVDVSCWSAQFVSRT